MKVKKLCHVLFMLDSWKPLIVGAILLFKILVLSRVIFNL